jgi:hypothetical protein
MATPVFPILTTPPAPFPLRGIEWSIDVTPDFSTEIQTSVSRREARISYDPFAHYTIKYSINVLRDLMSAVRNASRTYPANEIGTMWDFLGARRGPFEPFFFPVYWDKRIELQVIYPSSLVGITDYQVLRPFKDNGYLEPVGGIQPIVALTDFVYVNGTPAAFTRNVPYDGWVRLTAAPSPGSVISVSLSYYYKVRFLKDNGLSFRTFGNDVWECRSIEMRTVRP